MGIQTFTTPGGEEMVILPRSEYDALVEAAEEGAEDAADIAAYDAAVADQAGREPLPFELSQLILKGNGLLKSIRLWRDIGQVKLAYDIGTSQGFISDLENHRRKITPEIAARLAKALDVPEHWLIRGSAGSAEP
ncbi:MAG TPA: helix-turn-helix transcriptional regulator [Devosia sp.]|nr:helix-turn-helix transcriptional regulator [Devosia sp.]